MATHEQRTRQRYEPWSTVGWHPARGEKLAEVFYAFGKLVTSEGNFGEATAAFRRAVEFSERTETYRLRLRAAVRALRQSSHREVRRDGAPPVVLTNAAEIRRWDIVSFTDDMLTTRNVSISAPRGQQCSATCVRVATSISRPSR